MIRIFQHGRRLFPILALLFLLVPIALFLSLAFFYRDVSEGAGLGGAIITYYALYFLSPFAFIFSCVDLFKNKKSVGAWIIFLLAIVSLVYWTILPTVEKIRTDSARRQVSRTCSAVVDKVILYRSQQCAQCDQVMAVLNQSSYGSNVVIIDTDALAADIVAGRKIESQEAREYSVHYLFGTYGRSQTIYPGPAVQVTFKNSSSEDIALCDYYQHFGVVSFPKYLSGTAKAFTGENVLTEINSNLEQTNQAIKKRR
jgi:hypothetical protein